MRILGVVLSFSLFAAVGAQITVAQFDPSQPSGFSTTVFSDTNPGTMKGGPNSHGIFAVCNGYGTSKTLRLWCDGTLVAEVGILAGDYWWAPTPPGSIWPACENDIVCTMSTPPSGPNVFIGTLVTVPGY